MAGRTRIFGLTGIRLPSLSLSSHKYFYFYFIYDIDGHWAHFHWLIEFFHFYEIVSFDRRSHIIKSEVLLTDIGLIFIG